MVMYANCSFLPHQWLARDEFGLALHIYIYTAWFVRKSVYRYTCIYTGHMCIY